MLFLCSRVTQSPCQHVYIQCESREVVWWHPHTHGKRYGEEVGLPKWVTEMQPVNVELVWAVECLWRRLQREEEEGKNAVRLQLSWDVAKADDEGKSIFLTRFTHYLESCTSKCHSFKYRIIEWKKQYHHEFKILLYKYQTIYELLCSVLLFNI